MAKSEPQIDDLRERLSGLLADWETEISAVMRALENQQSVASTHIQKAQALESQVGELTELRQRIRNRDLALDHHTKKSKEKDARIAELEKEYKKALARVEELEQKVSAPGKPAQNQNGGQQAEFEAMRAELAARKSMVKSLRADAERGKKLEKELAENREIIEKLNKSIEHHVKTIADLRRSAESAGRKPRRPAEATNKAASRDSDSFSDSDIFLTETAVGMFLDESKEIDGGRTIVIDMTEPLREARDERLKKTKKG